MLKGATKGRHIACASLCAAAAFALVGTAIAGNDAFLDRLQTVQPIASTVPASGDVNPYGVAIVPRSIGTLVRGNALVSNFNNSGNLQGTGSTIMQVSPQGMTSVFAQIGTDGAAAACPGGIGLTTALVALRRGWVVVGSLPTQDGTAATASAGCLIVLDSNGQVVEIFQGNGINGPWDMTATDEGDRVLLFVTNVLNGDVTIGPPHVVPEGTVLRIALDVPQAGRGLPQIRAMTVIGSKLAEISDPAALVIGPTGVALGNDGMLYVADSAANRVIAIPQATTRQTSAMTGIEVTRDGALNDPLGLVVAPNGDIVTANGNNGNLVETTPHGTQVAVRTVETATGAGSLFGLAIPPGPPAVYFVDDGDNTLKALVR